MEKLRIMWIYGGLPQIYHTNMGFCWKSKEWETARCYNVET